VVHHRIAIMSDFEFGGEIAWRPTREYIEHSRLKDFMDRHGLRDYAALLERSTTDLAWFWNAVIADLDIVVSSSHYESFGRTLLEAMACERVVVATNVGGIPEVVEEYANRLIKPGDADALAQALLDHIDRPAETLVEAQALRERVANEFSADQMVDAVIASYQEARVNAARRASTQAVYSRPGVLT